MVENMENKLLSNIWVKTWIGLTVFFFVLYMVPVVIGSDQEQISSLLIGSLFLSTLLIVVGLYIKVVYEYWDTNNTWYRGFAAVMTGFFGLMVLLGAREAIRKIKGLKSEIQ